MHWQPPLSTDGRLTDKVFAWITEEIIHGGLRPGEWISEAQVAEELGVSRSPVHQALQVLAAIRIVEVVPRRGTKIADPSAREVDDLYRTRAFVDGELASMAVKNGSETFPAEVEALIKSLHDVIGDDKKYFDALERIWARLRDDCDNSALAEVSALLGRRSIPIRGMLLRIPNGPQINFELVSSLGTAIVAGDPDAAREEAAEVLENSRRYALEYLFLPTREGLRSSTRLDRR
jgi:DNA-binding GntR family transcriptional regulator